MEYQVLEIQTNEELKGCPLFKVDQFNWGGDYRPVTYGQLGYLRGRGLCLTMTCEEKEPCRIYKEANSAVYQDSAMEAFFCFDPGSPEPVYLNFEINANGAMLAAFGKERAGREFIPELVRSQIAVSSTIKPDLWQISLFIPLEVLKVFYRDLDLQKNSTFTCNFYKIKESPGQTHFASFAPISAPAPDFHLPLFFSGAQIL